MKIVAPLVVAALLLCGCSAETKFIPRGQDLSQAAHFIGDSDDVHAGRSSDAQYIFFIDADGKQLHGYWDVRKWSNELYLLPGHHTFTVRFAHASVHADGRFSVDAKAGATYYIHHAIGAYSVRLWVTEGANGTKQAATPIPMT
ncbi:hypothetical protein [Rhodanobacter sp. C05]|uniref:hypothetical protein n=1 Tax=Rhodanobacter sp. C05 TaxID=1945855 RepID=UPI00098655B1|nr:hypothetical protein [Rhodanobacter sp. C05]